jgi:hypothetical protein
LLALLFATASLIGLALHLQQAGWSLRRADPRSVYWCLVGMGLGLVFALKVVMPAPLFALAVGALGAALLYGVVADWQGWWRRRR